MATIAFFNDTRRAFAAEEVDLAGLKVMLVNGYTFDASHDMSDIVGDEVSGNGWDAGGEALESAAITLVNTNEAMLDASDLSITATGSSIGPADGAVILDSTSSPDRPLFFIDFEGSEEAGVGTPFNINWNASGIARWVAP